MRLHQSAWPEIEAYLTRSKGIIIPIGSTEQHGPNGLIGTDALCPEIIANEAAANDENILIGPTFNVGCAQHHMAFPGSMTLRPSTMIATIHDWVQSLTRHGFERIYFLNGHGGNVATINAAFSEIYADGSLNPQGDNQASLTLLLRNWWELEGVFALCKKLYPTGHGSHATPSEVAVTYYAYPESIKNVTLEPEIAPNGPIRGADDYRKRFADGRIGSNPGLATVEDGKKLVDLASKKLVTDFQKFVAA